AYSVTTPPSTRSACPVITDVSSDVRNARAPQRSSGRSERLMACWSTTSENAEAGRPASDAGVRVNPGARAFTVIPIGPSSTASARVNPSKAPLLATYIANPGPGGDHTVFDTTFTTRPNPRSAIAGASAWISSSGAVTLTATTRRHASTSTS